MPGPPPDHPPGYHGRYLRVDLTRGTANSIDWETGVLRNFLGGSGLGTYLMFREGSPEWDIMYQKHFDEFMNKQRL